MFINKSPDGGNNLCGKALGEYRRRMGLSQRQLADRLQLAGLDLDKNAIQRIECGKRFVTDVELATFHRVFEIPLETLLQL